MHSGMDKKRGGPGGYSGSSRHSPGSSMPSTLPTSYHPRKFKINILKVEPYFHFYICLTIHNDFN